MNPSGSGALIATLAGAIRTRLPHRQLAFVALVVAGECLVEVQSASAQMVALGGRPLPLAWALVRSPRSARVMLPALLRRGGG